MWRPLMSVKYSLETALGMLCIRGSDLHVNRLTPEKGEVDVSGQIDSLSYSDVGSYKKQGESLLLLIISLGYE